MKALFAETKSAFLSHQVNVIRMPNWPELKMEKIIDLVKDDDEIKKYFKDDFADLKKPHSKPYMMNIINTVYPGLLQGLVGEAGGLRNTTEGEEKQKEAIVMTSRWKELLDATPYTSQ